MIIVTYDELLQKIKGLVGLLKTIGPEASQTAVGNDYDWSECPF